MVHSLLLSHQFQIVFEYGRLMSLQLVIMLLPVVGPQVTLILVFSPGAVVVTEKDVNIEVYIVEMIQEYFG